MSGGFEVVRVSVSLEMKLTARPLSAIDAQDRRLAGLEDTRRVLRERCGRVISFTEACHLLNVSAQTAIDALNEAAEEGHVTPSNKARRGRDFHYLPTTPATAADS